MPMGGVKRHHHFSCDKRQNWLNGAANAMRNQEARCIIQHSVTFCNISLDVSMLRSAMNAP